MTTRIQSPTALPIYLQISENLIRDIAAGRLVDGERLQPEREMSSQHGVSVGTLRKALRELEKRGLLERVQGSGNYIRHQPDVASVYSMFRLELIAGGGLPRAEIVSLDDMTKPEDLPAFGQSETGTRIRRLRYLNETLVAIEEIWLDGAAGAVDALRVSDSLYRYYQRHLGFRIARAEDRVGLSSVPAWRPPAFDMAVGQPCGYIERFSWRDGDVAPVEFSKTWFDTTKALYVQRLK
ncbi:GntR family transcriptional regulator [Roseibium sp.]|uniref:GntR family transcriptional regulator n=1 Tax=Roseibium sp. TaxID=1936156 RepID=UPI003A9781DC